MNFEDVKIGMKVVPIKKTVLGNLESSANWKEAKKIHQPYLYVTKSSISIPQEQFCLSVDLKKSLGGDYFHASDFEPYVENFSLAHLLDFISGKINVRCYTDESVREFINFLRDRKLQWIVKHYSSYCEIIFMDSLHGAPFWSNNRPYIKFVELEKQQPTKEHIDVIYNGKETIVIIHREGDKKYYKGISKCNPEDVYDKKTGFEIALKRARIKMGVIK